MLCLRTSNGNECNVTLQHYNKVEKKWVLLDADGRKHFAEPKDIEVVFDSPSRSVTLQGLKRRRSELNGTQVTLKEYQADTGLYVAQCGKVMRLLRPEEVGMPAPIIPVTTEKGVCLRTQRKVQAREVLYEELPIMKISLHEGWPEVAKAFCALPTEKQDEVLSLCEREENAPDYLILDILHDAQVVLSPADKPRVCRACRIFETNSIHHMEYSGTHFNALFLTVSRMNHSCAPNAYHVCVDKRKRVVALRDLQPGEEIIHSYLQDKHLLLPFAKRKELLSRWFEDCWCTRCNDDFDDSRSFPCPSCGGVCYASRLGADISPCKCGEKVSDVGALLKTEESVVQALTEIERNTKVFTLSSEFLVSARKNLHASHWVLASYLIFAVSVISKLHGKGELEDDMLEIADELLREDLACWNRISWSSLQRASKSVFYAFILYRMGKGRDAALSICDALAETRSLLRANDPSVMNWMKHLRAILEDP